MCLLCYLANIVRVQQHKNKSSKHAFLAVLLLISARGWGSSKLLNQFGPCQLITMIKLRVLEELHWLENYFEIFVL